jgi:hypothetical protein
MLPSGILGNKDGKAGRPLFLMPLSPNGFEAKINQLVF